MARVRWSSMEENNTALQAQQHGVRVWWIEDLQVNQLIVLHCCGRWLLFPARVELSERVTVWIATYCISKYGIRFLSTQVLSFNSLTNLSVVVFAAFSSPFLSIVKLQLSSIQRSFFSLCVWMSCARFWCVIGGDGNVPWTCPHGWFQFVSQIWCH